MWTRLGDCTSCSIYSLAQISSFWKCWLPLRFFLSLVMGSSNFQDAKSLQYANENSLSQNYDSMNQSESINDISMYFSIFFNVSQLISTYFCDLIISDQRIYGNLHVHPRGWTTTPWPGQKGLPQLLEGLSAVVKKCQAAPHSVLMKVSLNGGYPQIIQSLDHFSTETDWNPWFWGSPVLGNPHI